MQVETRRSDDLGQIKPTTSWTSISASLLHCLAIRSHTHTHTLTVCHPPIQPAGPDEPHDAASRDAAGFLLAPLITIRGCAGSSSLVRSTTRPCSVFAPSRQLFLICLHASAVHPAQRRGNVLTAEAMTGSKTVTGGPEQQQMDGMLW